MNASIHLAAALARASRKAIPVAKPILQSRSISQRLSQTQWPAQRLHCIAAVAQPSARRSVRAFSTEGPDGTKIYNFDDVRTLTLSTSPSSPITIIDVREPSELQSTGRIPGALNIPVTSAPDAFFIPEEEFEERFGFERPEREREVVFYCKSGVRSHAAAGFAKQAGWERVGEYKGSWLDWEKRGGEVEK